MATYLETFRLPIDEESSLIAKRMAENGGIYGYIDNAYPCGLFGPKELFEINFREITIFYGGNGSGKSTLLNLIAAKLELNRVAPHNSGELFDAYAKRCSYGMGHDEEGFKYRIPNGSRIITSDDVFDYMLTVRTNNTEIREEIERGKDEYRALKYGETVKFNGMEDQILCKNATIDLAKGVYYLEEDNMIFGVRQLLDQVKTGLFAAVPTAGPSWRPELKSEYVPHAILDKHYDVNAGLSMIGATNDGSDVIMSAFCQSCITG